MENMPLGELARLASDVREQKRALDRESKDLGAKLDEIKGLIYAKLEKEGLDRTAVDGITLSRSDTVVPTVTDWDAVEGFIKDRDLLYLYQRRLSATVWRELIEDGVEIPGVEGFTKRDVNIRVS